MEDKVFYYDNEMIMYPCTELGFKQAIEDQIMWSSTLKKTFEQIREELFESINYSVESLCGKFICLDPFQFDVHNSFTFLVCDTQEELEEAYEQACGDI